MKKLLLTGGTGLIGKAVCEELKNTEDLEIYGLTYDNSKPYKEINWINADLYDKNKIDDIFKNLKPEYLLHLAWPSVVDLETELHDEFYKISMNMLETFYKNGGCRAVYIGSVFEYLFKDNKLKETDELNPTTEYARAKVNLYKDASLFTKENNLSFSWGRIFYVYGLNEHPKRLTSTILNGLKNNTAITIKTSQLFKDYIYTKDIAGALIKLVNSDVCGPINICSGQAIKIADFAKSFAKKLGKESLLDLQQISTDQPPIIVGDNTRLTKEVGYTLRYSLDDAISEILRGAGL